MFDGAAADRVASANITSNATIPNTPAEIPRIHPVPHDDHWVGVGVVGGVVGVVGGVVQYV